jgi:hypothetical protein
VLDRSLKADEEAFQRDLLVLEGETDAGKFPTPERVLALVVRKNQLEKARAGLNEVFATAARLQERANATAS